MLDSSNKLRQVSQTRGTYLLTANIYPGYRSVHHIRGSVVRSNNNSASRWTSRKEDPLGRFQAFQPRLGEGRGRQKYPRGM